MNTATRRHICAITFDAAKKLCEEAGNKPVDIEMMRVDPNRVVSVKREAYGTIAGKAYWSRYAVAELNDSP